MISRKTRVGSASQNFLLFVKKLSAVLKKCTLILLIKGAGTAQSL
jgi:hypothetical protein